MSFVDFSICENAHAYAIHVFNSQSLQVSIFFVFIPFFTEMSIVLITCRSSGSNQMEIINPDNSTTKCQNDYNYPISVRGASGAVVDGTIVVCGGRSPTTKKQCYSFGFEKEWKNITDMTTVRAWAASVPFNSDALWVGGGHDGNNYLKSTELVYLDGRRSSTKQLPKVRRESCAAEYNGNIYFTGGWDGNYDAQNNNWIINTKDDFKVTDGPNMLKKREGHSCGIFHSHAHSGRAVIVTAGGFGTGRTNCEFWDFTVPGETWQLCSKSCLIVIWQIHVFWGWLHCYNIS